MKIKNIIFFICLFILTSCVSGNFNSYQTINNLKKTGEYYELKTSDEKISYVKVGIHTLYNRENTYFIKIDFKEKPSEDLEIESSNFGKIGVSPENNSVYLKQLHNWRGQNDTIYLKFPYKVYAFYYDKTK
jgi:hypothetical protein